MLVREPAANQPKMRNIRVSHSTALYMPANRIADATCGDEEGSVTRGHVTILVKTRISQLLGEIVSTIP